MGIRWRTEGICRLLILSRLLLSVQVWLAVCTTLNQAIRSKTARFCGRALRGGENAECQQGQEDGASYREDKSMVERRVSLSVIAGDRGCSRSGRLSGLWPGVLLFFRVKRVLGI